MDRENCKEYELVLTLAECKVKEDCQYKRPFQFNYEGDDCMVKICSKVSPEPERVFSRLPIIKPNLESKVEILH